MLCRAHVINLVVWEHIKDMDVPLVYTIEEYKKLTIDPENSISIGYVMFSW